MPTIFALVKNKKGTSDKKPPAGYSSWIDFWEKKTKRKTKSCLALLCSNGCDVGGHVIVDGEGGKEYILPICQSHNQKDDSFFAFTSDLVPVS